MINTEPKFENMREKLRARARARVCVCGNTHMGKRGR